MNEEDDMNLMDQNNMGIDQLQLTQEEKDEAQIKTLTADNPQAAHNICQFSFKDRNFKVEEQVEARAREQARRAQQAEPQARPREPARVVRKVKGAQVD